MLDPNFLNVVVPLARRLKQGLICHTLGFFAIQFWSLMSDRLTSFRKMFQRSFAVYLQFLYSLITFHDIIDIITSIISFS